jgi:hypothetical protein
MMEQLVKKMLPQILLLWLRPQMRQPTKCRKVVLDVNIEKEHVK